MLIHPINRAKSEPKCLNIYEINEKTPNTRGFLINIGSVLLSQWVYKLKLFQFFP